MQPNQDVLGALSHPTKPVVRNIISAGRRAQAPVILSPDVSNLGGVPEQDSSDSDGSDSDGDGEDMEGVDRFELRRQFFELLVTEWKSRRAVSRVKTVIDPQRSVSSVYGRNRGAGCVQHNFDATTKWTSKADIAVTEVPGIQTQRINQNGNIYSLYATMLGLPTGRTNIAYYAHAYKQVPRQVWTDALHSVSMPSVVFPGAGAPSVRSMPILDGQGCYQPESNRSTFYGKMHTDTVSINSMQSMGCAPTPILFRCHQYNTIMDVLVNRAYLQSQSETQWTLGWVGRPWVRGVYSQIHIDQQQRVNHCRNFFELTRKDAQSKNVKKLRRTMVTKARTGDATAPSVGSFVAHSPLASLPLGSVYSHIQEDSSQPELLQISITPDTYVLPKEQKMFLEAFKQSVSPSWIMKPVARCQGQGIFLFDKLKSVQDWIKAYNSEEQVAEVYVVQEYISRPLLVGKKKFDLRLYVLVSSYEPLTVWMNRGGFCRFSSSRFRMDKEDRANNQVHQTNVAVQKGGADYDDESGGKWGVGNLKTHLLREYGAAAMETAMLDIQDCILKSLLSVKNVTVCDETSFALYGFDIMLDDRLKSWVIEVNACPSLSANTPHDYNLKFAMLSDAQSIVDPDNSRTHTETTVGSWDLIFSKQNHVIPAPSLGTVRSKGKDESATLGSMQHTVHPKTGQILHDFTFPSAYAKYSPSFPSEDPLPRVKAEPRVDQYTAVTAAIVCEEKIDNPFLSASPYKPQMATSPSHASYQAPYCPQPSPFYECGYSVHAELPLHKSLIDPPAIQPQHLHQQSMLGGHDDRLDQLPVLFGVVDNIGSQPFSSTHSYTNGSVGNGESTSVGMKSSARGSSTSKTNGTKRSIFR